MWLFALARNTLLNHRRTLGRYKAAVDRLRGSIIEDVALDAQDTALEQVELRRTVAHALGQLEPGDAELVCLINWDGFSLAEVARLEGLSPSTVRSRYSAALRKVEALLPSDITRVNEEEACQL